MVSLPDPTALYEVYSRELAWLWLQQRHRVDERGRCSACWTVCAWWWPWPRRSTCTVYTALSCHLRRPDRLVLAGNDSGMVGAPHD